MSDNKEHCPPVAYCAPDKNGLPNFGKGWCFSKLKNEQATMPLYAAAQPVVLTDEQIINAFEPHIDSDPTAPHDMPTYWVRQDELIAYTRAILAAKEQA